MIRIRTKPRVDYVFLVLVLSSFLMSGIKTNEQSFALYLMFHTENHDIDYIVLVLIFIISDIIDSI